MKIALILTLFLFLSNHSHGLRCDAFVKAPEALPFGKIMQLGSFEGVIDIPRIDLRGLERGSWGNRLGENAEGSIIVGSSSQGFGGPQRIFRFSMNGFLPVDFAELPRQNELVIYGKIKQSVPKSERGLTGHEGTTRSMSDHFEIQSLGVTARIWPHTRKFEIRFDRTRLLEVLSIVGTAQLVSNVLNGSFERNVNIHRPHHDPDWRTFHYKVDPAALNIYAVVLGKTTGDRGNIIIDTADLGTHMQTKRLLEQTWGPDNLAFLQFFNGQGAMMSHAMHPSLNRLGPIPLLGTREPDLEAGEMYQGKEIDYYNRELNPTMGPWNLDYFEHGA